MPYHITAILSVALLAACGTDAPADRSVPASREGLVVIEMTDDMTFAPDTITAAVGDTIVWVNRGDLPHTATARADFLPLEQLPSSAESWDSGLMDAGAEFRIVVQATGEYRYVCTLHQAAGMVAHFRVK